MNTVGRTALILVTLAACRGASPSAQAISQQQLTSLVDSLMPGVAKAAGLEFKSTPKSAVRTKDQIRTYLVAKMARELPEARLEGISATYRLLHMMPDSVDLRALFLELYVEQIVGFYDPDSSTLFAVQGGEPSQVRLVLAHELAHALQHQYVPLDSILRDVTDGDRQAAAQAVMEGQATLVSLVAMLPGMDITSDVFWETMRDQLRNQQKGTSVYARSPMVIRETLTFPYISGADFMRSFDKAHPGKVPYGAMLPKSTEQLLHPDRYEAGDAPVTLRFAGDTSGVIFEDTFGEFSIELLRAQLIGATDVVRTDPAIGWGGDRFRIYRTADGPALVWLTTWDEPRYALQFRSQVADPLAKLPRPGYRTSVEPQMLGGKAAVRIVVAPTGWMGWKSLPGIELKK